MLFYIILHELAADWNGTRPMTQINYDLSMNSCDQISHKSRIYTMCVAQGVYVYNVYFVNMYGKTVLLVCIYYTQHSFDSHGSFGTRIQLVPSGRN